MTALAVGVPLALILLVAFLGDAHASVILILTSVLDCILVAKFVHRLVLNLAGGQPQTAEDAANQLSQMAELAFMVATALGAIGQVRGWMHGTFRDLVLSIATLYVIGAPAYWLGGKRRLLAVLRTRGYQ